MHSDLKAAAAGPKAWILNRGCWATSDPRTSRALPEGLWSGAWSCCGADTSVYGEYGGDIGGAGPAEVVPGVVEVEVAVPRLTPAVG